MVSRLWWDLPATFRSPLIYCSLLVSRPTKKNNLGSIKRTPTFGICSPLLSPEGSATRIKNPVGAYCNTSFITCIFRDERLKALPYKKQIDPC
jgi:hypothetical protein